MSKSKKPPPENQLPLFGPGDAPPAQPSAWDPRQPDYRVTYTPPPALPPIPVAPTGQRAQVVQDMAIDLAENDLYGKWFAFHRKNPHVYRLMREIALGWKLDDHRPESGIRAATEDARWERHFTTTGAKYKLPNAHLAFYSRFLMEREPLLKGFFTTTTLRTSVWPTDPAHVAARAATVA